MTSNLYSRARTVKRAVLAAILVSSVVQSAHAQQPTSAASVLTKAATKNVVQEAQHQLQALGYDPGSADGAIGPRTIAVLKQFQSDHNLPVTGALDQKTLEGLGVGSGSKAAQASRAIKPNAEDKERDAWASATARATPDAYLAYVDAHPDTTRLRIVDGAVSAAGFVRDNQVSSVRITLGSQIQITLGNDEAQRLGLPHYEPSPVPEGFASARETGNFTVSHPNMRVLLSLDPGSPQILAARRLSGK